MAATKYAYYRHDTFVYRTPEFREGRRLDADAIKQMEIWNGREWMPVTSAADQMTVMTYGGPIPAEQAEAQAQA